MLTTDQIVRPDIFQEAMQLHYDYLKKMTGYEDDAEIKRFVKDTFRERYQGKRIIYNKTVSPGNEKIVEDDFYKFLNQQKSKVITPAGSMYKPTIEQSSFIAEMVVDKLKERKKVKKKQLAAEAVGDDLEAKRCWYQQATIKINCNSLPGGFGSPFNIFYDKPGYNTITSAARCMIVRAYTVAEQLLGGNFSWFSEDELVNHILLNLRLRPSDDQINQAIQKYKLKMIDHMQLIDFYTETLHRYCPGCQMASVDRLVSRLTPLEVTFLFYYCNLRHIMWYNSEIFKGFIHYVFDTSKVQLDPNVTADDIFKQDETVLAITTVGLAKEFNNYSIKIIVEEHPELIPKVVAYCKSIEKKVHMLDLLFDTFVNTDADIPEVRKKQMTWRNTVIISDTDSEIFTAAEWDDWYRGGIHYDITDESYQITSLVIYWLHHSVRHACYRYSILHGVSPEHRRVLAMKNEFLYPIMLLFGIKKTYCGIQAVQEGVILPKPKADIKGQTLRGSSICSTSLDFIQNFIENDVLYPSIQGKLSANKLIDKVLGWEHNIMDSIKRGETEFLQITSLKYERDYSDPESTSVFFAWMFWQAVYAKQYGDVQPPAKVIYVSLYTPTAGYYQELEKMNKHVYQETMKFVEQHKKFPNNVLINPAANAIPKEIIPLVDYKKIIYHNCSALYRVLNKLNIGVAHLNKETKTLLMDLYG